MSQGTFVEIIDFNQLPNGLLGITVKGSQKVSIKSVEQTETGLHFAAIAPISEPTVDDQAVLAQFPDLLNVLSQLKEHPSIKSLPCRAVPRSATSSATLFPSLFSSVVMPFSTCWSVA